MNLIVNYPASKDAIAELEKRVAEFRATLVVEKIKRQNLSDSSKKELLNAILEHLRDI